MEITYEIVRSKTRKSTTSLEVTESGRVIVKAPYTINKAAINEFVYKNLEWIKMRLLAVKKRPQISKKFITGELLPYQGDVYPLSVSLSSRKYIKVTLHNNMFFIWIPQNSQQVINPSMIRSTLIAWYGKMAKKIITPKVQTLTQQLGYTYGSIRIKDTKTRWGSCSSVGNLNFHWKLILAPEEIMQYVLIHEICHLEYPHHKASFWAKVATLDNEYRAHREWLKTNSWKLNI